MKYIKKYETLDAPKKGDYVLLKPDMFQEDFKYFIRTEIGRIINVQTTDSFPYTVIYSEKTPQYSRMILSVDMKDILHYSSDKKELQTIIDANKYNL